MLRGVTSVSLLCAAIFAGAPATAFELITHPTPPSGSLAYAPMALATIDIDWLGLYAERGLQLNGLMSGDSMMGGVSAAADVAGPLWTLDPPATAQRIHWLEPYNF